MNEGFRLDQLFHSRPKGVFFLILLSWWQTMYFVLKTSVFFRGNYHCHMQFYCLSLVPTKQCGTNYCTTALLHLSITHELWNLKKLCDAFCYLFEKLKGVFALNTKSNGPVLLFKATLIFKHWDYFLVVCRALWMARMDIIWNLKKNGPTFSSTDT